MFCALFTLFATAWGYGNNLCFDLEKNGRGDSSQAASDDSNESTNCRVEARAKACHNNGWVYRYVNGVGNDQESSDEDPGCINFGTPVHLYPVEIQMTCSDAMWIDKFYLHRYDSSSDRDCGGKQDETYVWGVNNHKGWCMSTDQGDAEYFKKQELEVPANKCYQAFKLLPNHYVMGRTGGGYFDYWGWRRLEEEDVSQGEDEEDVSEMTVAQEAEVALKAQAESDVTARLGGERRRPTTMCECEKAGAGTVGLNKIICENEPDRYCAHNEVCFSNAEVNHGQWEDLCKPEMCRCASPPDGTANGSNKIDCDFDETRGHTRYCAYDEYCYSHEEAIWGEWEKLCVRAIKG